MLAFVYDMDCLLLIEWPENVSKIGPTRCKNDTTMWILGRYLGLPRGVPCGRVVPAYGDDISGGAMARRGVHHLPGMVS